MSKTKRIIAAVTAAIITATSSSLMSVFADENGGSDLGFVSSGAKAETDNNETVISEAQLYDKLGQLLKDGDSLKYGEALYTAGTPDGEKWTKEFYEQRVDFYGEEFLAKYIVNGEFLRDKVVSDMAEITTKENNSGLKATAEDINEYMRSNGISGFTYVREVDGVERIFISYDGFFEKIKAYVVDTGVDESFIVYQQSEDYAIVSDKSENDKSAEESCLKAYAKDISDFLLRSGIAGDAFVRDDKVVVTYSAYEDKIKTYIREKGVDESVIVYEAGKNVADTSEEDKKSTLKETAENINEYMRSNGISGSTHVHEDDGVEKIFITYDGFFEKIQAYVVGTGVDENLVVYQQSQDHATGTDKSENDKSEEDIDFTKGTKAMTLDDVKEIAKKKSKITWSDFADFKCEWSSTDRYTHMGRFELEDGYYLLVQGNPPEALDVIRLYHKDDPDFIDLRYHNVDKYIGEQFLKELKNMSEEELQAFFSEKNMTEEKGFKAWTKETAPRALDNYFLTFLVKLPASFTDKNGNEIINETADIKELSRMAEDNSFDEQLNSFLGSLDVNICDQFALSGHFIYRSEGSGDAKVYRRYIVFSVNGTVGSKFTRDEANQMLASALNYIQFSPQFAGFEYESKIPRYGADDKGTLKGDANNDGQVDLADAVLIMQCLANPDKYKLSAEGRANADIDGDGVTVGDAQNIQKRLLNIIDYITDLDTIRTMISDYIADQLIHITVVPKEKMPEKFADKYVFVKWNAPISDGLSYDNFLIKNYIDQSLIKNIPYDIDDDSELNKLCEKLYLYVLENSIPAGVHKSKDKVVVEYNWFYKDVREKIEAFIKDNSIDPESVIIDELE